jgi:hypothetical protein
MRAILEDAKRLHSQSVKLLVGVLAGKVVPNSGYTKQDIIKTLKQDIAASKKLLDRYGWRDNA